MVDLGTLGVIRQRPSAVITKWVATSGEERERVTFFIGLYINGV